MILGWAKNLNTTPDYILYDISYENVILYTRATPQYNDEKDDWDEEIDANVVGNFDDEDIINEEDL